MKMVLDLFLTKLRRILAWYLTTKCNKWILLKFMPGKRFTTKIPPLKGYKYHSGYERLQPGDIVLCIDTKAYTGASIKFITKGVFSHATVCVGKKGDKDYPGYEIAEILSEGYTKSFFYDIVHEASRVVILRCPFWPEDYRKRFTLKVKSFEDVKIYDIEFKLGVKALYCSELVYQADIEKTLVLNLEDFAGLGRPYISPTGLYKSPSLEVIWDSDLCNLILPWE